MIRTAIVAYLLFVIVAVHAHDGMHDDWFKSLRSNSGGVCCDGSDALRVEDPHWDIQDGHYRVMLDGKWIDVLDSRIVKTTNIVGYAVVWPYTSDGQTYVRCFMPGAVS
jgi:hypothetical protein